MWKWLIIVAAGYFLFRMFTNDRKHKDDDSQAERENLIATGELVKDPTCGVFIEKDSSISVREGDTIHRFCSYECRDAFVKKIKALEATPELTKEETPEISKPDASKQEASGEANKETIEQKTTETTK